jgi:hypothetical protein
MQDVRAVAILLMVISPVLIPLMITGVHGLARWRQSRHLIPTTVGQ